MKVKNKFNKAVFYILDSDAAKLGTDATVQVYDHEPHRGGCEQTNFGNGIQMFRCRRKKSAPVKSFKGWALEKV